MRIAFTSCFSKAIVKDQPVWREIAAREPDVLVLLGDSIYLDCSGGIADDDASSNLDEFGIQKASQQRFAQHAYGLYAKQLDDPGFQALIARPRMKTFAIWDDHDFLWNNAYGAQIMQNPAKAQYVYPSRALFKAFRAALAGAGLPASPPDWTNATEPGYECHKLRDDLFLHLTDGRSWREPRGKNAALLGFVQLAQMEAAMKAAPPKATHLVATSTVFEFRKGETWLDWPAEYEKLLELGRSHDILVLSGDIHANRCGSSDAGQGRFVHEATSSGAAIRTKVVFGTPLHNWGMLDVDAAKIGIQFWNLGQPDGGGSIDQRAWTLTKF